MDTKKHKWTFPARFRRHAFGWRPQPAMTRIKEAVAEIKKTARKDPVLGAEGAVLFLEKLSPALEHVDSSSGALGTAVNKAIDTLVPLIAKTPADDEVRDGWLERLWTAVEEDEMPYIELLPDYWGELCVTRERASYWADTFIDTARRIWTQGGHAVEGYFKGTSACLSALFKAGRYEELLELLDCAPYKQWYYRQWGVKALAALGRKAEAIRYAEASRDDNYASPVAIAQACEEILLSSGMVEEAYRRYAIEANRKTTYLATFRAIAKKYPDKSASDILHDLVASTPGEEGKWFAAAKSAGLYEEAIELANRTPCDPRTLTRAAKEMAAKKPRFAVEAGMAALRWLAEGYGYEITGLDVLTAYRHTMEAAQNAGCGAETLEHIRKLVTAGGQGARFIAKILQLETLIRGFPGPGR